MINAFDNPDSNRGDRRGATFFVANLLLVEQFAAPLDDLVTEWTHHADAGYVRVVGNGFSNAARAFGSFTADEMCGTRSGALTLLLRHARDQVTQLLGLLRRIDQQMWLTSDSDSVAAARLLPSGEIEVCCAKCQRTIRFAPTACNVACRTCERLLIRDARTLRVSEGHGTKSRIIHCLADLPAVFHDHAVPDTFLSAFIERDSNEFSPVGLKADANGKYATVSGKELPGKKHPNRQSALSAMREFVSSRLSHLAKQRARLVREIA